VPSGGGSRYSPPGLRWGVCHGLFLFVALHFWVVLNSDGITFSVLCRSGASIQPAVELKMNLRMCKESAHMQELSPSKALPEGGS